MNLVSSDIIHKALFDRWKELDLSAADIIKDATERGIKGFTPSRMSKYKKKIHKESISDEQLRFLMVRYGIPFSWNLGYPQLNEGKLEWVMPKYDELKCISDVNKIFGNGKKD